MPIIELLAAARWWLVIMLLGAVATPMSLLLFKSLPDRGYAFVKLVGVLMVGYLFWILGSFGFLGNNVGGMVFALGGWAGISFWTARRGGVDTLQWVRENIRHVALTELLFALVFVIWVWVRAQNPAIAATEKPMEFAFLNAIGRSPSFPPSDPWLSGFAVSYYYFGYVMMSILAHLASVQEPIAFNLGIAWLVAGSAVAAFGLVYNLIAVGGTRRSAFTFGLMAAIALPIAGNLEVGLELLHGNGIGSDAFWQWLDVRELNQPAVITGTPRYEGPNWWWWRSSRVIHEYHLSGQAEEGLEPIAEFPGFSFVLGDMHPHVLALPFALLSLATAFNWWLLGIKGDRPLDASLWDISGWQGRARQLIAHIGLPTWAFSAVLLGGLSFLNTWDVLIHLLVVIGAFLLGQWWTQGWRRRIFEQTVAAAVLLTLPALVLYFPFYAGFRSQAGAPFLLPMLMRPTRAVHFLIIFGLPLWSIGWLLTVSLLRQRFRFWRSGAVAAVTAVLLLSILALLLGLIIAGSPEGAQRVSALADELGIFLAPRPGDGAAIGWGLGAVSALLPKVFEAKLAAPWLTILLGSALAASVMVWLKLLQESPSGSSDAALRVEVGGRAGSLPFVLLLVVMGVLLTLAPEFVYIRDNFGVRLNTVFKFYYQAWVMFGTAGIVALAHLLHEKGAAMRRFVSYLAMGGYLLGLAVALMFPWLAVRSRAVEFRGPVGSENRLPATLDGLATVNRFNPDEYAAIDWLRANVSGTPVILEAVGGQYSGYARISAATGLPTVLGWAGHELQWRGSANQEPGLRDPLVRQIYTIDSWDETVPLLNQFDVTYIYVGQLEKNTYGPSIDEKFAAHLDIAFQNSSVRIYQWYPE